MKDALIVLHSKCLVYCISHRSISSQSSSIAGDETVLLVLMVTAFQQTAQEENRESQHDTIKNGEALKYMLEEEKKKQGSSGCLRVELVCGGGVCNVHSRGPEYEAIQKHKSYKTFLFKIYYYCLLVIKTTLAFSAQSNLFTRVKNNGLVFMHKK